MRNCANARVLLLLFMHYANVEYVRVIRSFFPDAMSNEDCNNTLYYFDKQ